MSILLVSEFEIQSLRESDMKKKKKRHQEKKKKKKHVHTEDILTSVDSPTDSEKESDDGKSRDGYSSPDTGNLSFFTNYYEMIGNLTPKI